MKTAFLFLTTSDDPVTLERFRSIGGAGDKFVAYEKRLGLAFPEDVTTWAFDLAQFGYSPIAAKVVPGSTVLPLVRFLASHDYDSAWLLEDDVVFTGDWAAVDGLAEYPHDLVGVRLRFSGKFFGWFHTFRCPERASPGDFCFVASLLCACRMSRRCATALDALLAEGFQGHSEILIPTLAEYAGMEMTDLVALGMTDLRYFRWQSPLSRGEVLEAPDNTFIHPVKIPRHNART